jgi:hypothetical protein
MSCRHWSVAAIMVFETVVIRQRRKHESREISVARAVNRRLVKTQKKLYMTQYYDVCVVSVDEIFLTSFMKIDKLVQKFKLRKNTRTA